MKDKPKYPSYIYIYRQPDLTDLLNKPSKDATNSNSIRELTSKLEKVEKVLQLKGGETSEKVSEEPISATDKSALETTLVTDVVTKISESYGCKAVEGMLSYQMEKDTIDGKKTIIQNPTEKQRQEHENVTY